MASNDTEPSGSGRTVERESDVGRAGSDGRGHVGGRLVRADQWAWGVLPAALTLAGFAVAAVVGADVFVPGRSPLGAIVYLVLVPYYLVGVAGTVWVTRALAARRPAARTWLTTPAVYVAGGALVMETYFVATLGSTGLSGGRAAAYLAGRFFVSLPVASVVAGPLYLLASRYVLD